ncbi:type IV pilus modification protein PilV [Luteimonas sp. A277]
MHLHTFRPDRRHQGGSSLLEVLIAVLVLAIGLLGLAAMSATTLKNSNSSAARSQAVVHIYSLYDTLRLERQRAMDGEFNVNAWTREATAANADDTVEYGVFNAWLGQVQKSLGDPDARGRLVCDHDSCVAGIRWNDSRATGGETELEIETESRL